MGVDFSYALRIMRGMENIIRIWPTLSDLASDLDRPYQTVAAWKRRGRIPADYDLDLIEAAARRGHKLTLEQLARARRIQEVSQ